MLRRTLAGTKKRIAKSLCHPTIGLFLARAFRDRIPAAGCVVATDSPIVTPEIKAQLFWRFYESAEIRFVDKHLRRDLDVIELGSSLGVVTCRIRKLIHSSCKLICVEASPELARLTHLNLVTNALEKNVVVVNRAVNYDSPAQKTVTFLSGGSTLEGTVIKDEIGEDGGLAVQVATLSQILSENGIGDYVLVSDIEGSEAGIALYDADALRKCKQIIIELHDTTVSGASMKIEPISEAFMDLHSFALRDRYGSVFVFDKAKR
jgi:FkbM family methyltransferase